MIHAIDITADEALQRLIEGNERFLKGEANLRGLLPETLAKLARGQHPIEEIGEAVSFLASDRAATITGRMLAVDEGMRTGFGEDLRVMTQNKGDKND